MRIFVRNRQRYDPSSRPRPWITIDVTNFAGTHISHIKEICKRQMPMAKVDELYYKGHRLADENSMGFYQGRFLMEDNAIFETTSNPFWSACMLACIKEAEQEAAANPNCRNTQNWTKKTIIHRAAALGVLYNSNNTQERQPPPFETIDDLENFLHSHGKKELTMSRFTRLKLEKFHKELLYEHINRADPIGAFVHAQAVALGFRTDDEDDTIEHLMDNNGGVHNGGRRVRGAGAVGRGRGGRGARLGGGGREGAVNGGGQGRGGVGAGRGANRPTRQGNAAGRRNRQVMCADCETETASVYCRDCEQGLALCNHCSHNIHQGAARRRHQISDISEAPRVVSYTPKSFKAPFALLVALYYGITERPPLLSMTADEVKLRAQKYTDTDLWNKTAGRFFGGFDSMDKTLEKLGFVQKEGGQGSRYALQEAGKPLARKCVEFREAVDRLYTAYRIPKAPDQYRAVCGLGTVCLLIDHHEPLKDRLLSIAREKNIPAIVREIPVGDFLWVVLPPDVDIRYYDGNMQHREMVLPHVVERKTWDDLQDSMSGTRYRNQVKNMKLCGLHDLFYLMEGSVYDMKTKPTPEQQIRLQNELLRLQVRDGLLVNYTGSWLKTVQWLLQLTTMVTGLHDSGVNNNLMSFADLDDLVKTNRRLHPQDDQQMKSGTVYKLQGKHFVDMIFSDFQNEVKFTDAVRADIQSVPMRQRERRNRSLLVIENLREYNKERQRLLDRALASYINQPMPGIPAHEIVENELAGSVLELVHFDAFTYWQLWLQVHIGVYVCRTEAADETQKVQRLFEEHHRTGPTRTYPHPGPDGRDDGGDDGNGAHDGGGRNRSPTHLRNHRRGRNPSTSRTDESHHQEQIPHIANVAGVTGDLSIHGNQDDGTFDMEDFAPDSQSEDAMLQQVMALSAQTSRSTVYEDDEQVQLALEISREESRSTQKNQRRRKDDQVVRESGRLQDEIPRSRPVSEPLMAREVAESPGLRRVGPQRSNGTPTKLGTPRKRSVSDDATVSPPSQTRQTGSSPDCGQRSRSARKHGRKEGRQAEPGSRQEGRDKDTRVGDSEDEDLKRALQLSLEESRKAASEGTVESESAEDEDLKRAIELSLKERQMSTDGVVTRQKENLAASCDSHMNTHGKEISAHDKSVTEADTACDGVVIAHDSDDTLDDVPMQSVDDSVDLESDGHHRITEDLDAGNGTAPEPASSIRSHATTSSTVGTARDLAEPDCDCRDGSASDSKCKDPRFTQTDSDKSVAEKMSKEDMSSQLPDTVCVSSQVCNGANAGTVELKTGAVESPVDENQNMLSMNAVPDHENFDGETMSYNFNFPDPEGELGDGVNEDTERDFKRETGLSVLDTEKSIQPENTILPSSTSTQSKFNRELDNNCQESLKKTPGDSARSCKTDISVSVDQTTPSSLTRNHSAINDSANRSLDEYPMDDAIDLTDSQESEIDLTRLQGLSDSQESLYVCDGDDFIPVISKEENPDNARKESVTEDCLFSLLESSHDGGDSTGQSAVVTKPQDKNGSRVNVVTPRRQNRNGSPRGGGENVDSVKCGGDSGNGGEDAELARILRMSREEYEVHQRQVGGEVWTDRRDDTTGNKCLSDEEFARQLQRQYEQEASQTPRGTETAPSDRVPWQDIITAAASRDYNRWNTRASPMNAAPHAASQTATKRRGADDDELRATAKKQKLEEEKDFEIALRYHAFINDKGSNSCGDDLGEKKPLNKSTTSKSKQASINIQKQLEEYRKQMREQNGQRNHGNVTDKSVSSPMATTGPVARNHHTRPSATVLPRTSTSRVATPSRVLDTSSSLSPRLSTPSIGMSPARPSVTSASPRPRLWSLLHTVPVASIDLSDDDDDLPDVSQCFGKMPSSAFSSLPSSASSFHLSSSMSSPATSAPHSSSTWSPPKRTASPPPPPQVQQVNRQANMTCGNCHQKGHNRTSKSCPQYFSESEVARRKERADKIEREKEEERQKLERVLTRLRENDEQVQQFKEQVLRNCDNLRLTSLVEEVNKMKKKKRKR